MTFLSRFTFICHYFYLKVYQKVVSLSKSPFIDQEESEIVFDEQVKQNVKKVFLKVKKLVKCDQCPKTFYEQIDLETHIQNSHKKTQDTQVPKRLMCTECEYSCGDKSLLQKHIDVVHLKVKPGFNCKKCNKVFVTGMKLKKHKIRCKQLKIFS